MMPADPVSSRRDQALDWLLRVQQAPHDAQLRAALAQWCASDVANAEAYGKAERVWRLTGQQAPTTAEQWPPLPAANVVPLPSKRSHRRWWLGAAVAACLMVAVAPSLSVRLQADYRTAQGETRDITLADGSVVQMDSNTAIAVSYAGTRRDVRLLSGQAFFKVTPDPSKPFHVRAAEVRVTVTGTAFNVELRPGGVDVDVEHGSVRVDDAKRSRALSSALTAGQRLHYVDGLVQVRTFQPSQAAAWRQGQLIADETSVAELVEALGRYLPGKVVLKDKGLGEKRVTGVYDLRKPQAALSAVVRPHGGKVTSYGPWLVVLSRP
ncbi:transmembrane sensor [Pseudomonas hunanensis]|uniref:Transmembrane sensor n=1 Tax=Pseudomonas hunanensis TaxID=1247546 RepID=A0ACC6K1D2_9PSED|nr:FecR family protein [Pseudomonas hunanensis]MDR6712266.1 transmembrane sensor [Pseudomonas hunanensis]